MTNLPRLELTEDINKNNDFIIFRNASKDEKIKNHSNKHVYKKKHTTKRKRRNSKGKKSRKGFFNIF
jgi:hypothetical protein